MYELFFLLCLITRVMSLSINQLNPEKMIKIYKFVPCNTSSIVKFNTSTLMVTGGIGELTIDGYVNITEDIKAPIKMSMTAKKCDQQGFNCENYISFDYADCCQLLNIPFFTFLKGFEPEIKSCPIKKTIEKASGLRYDLSAWMHLALYQRFWTRYNFFDDNLTTVICFEFGSEFFPKRSSRRNRKKKGDKIQ